MIFVPEYKKLHVKPDSSGKEHKKGVIYYKGGNRAHLFIFRSLGALRAPTASSGPLDFVIDALFFSSHIFKSLKILLF